MRTFASFVMCILSGACGLPIPPAAESPAPLQELRLPAQYASSSQVLAYAKFDGSVAAETTELHYGLADSYPRKVSVTAQGGYVLGKECSSRLGEVRWQAVGELQGTAASLQLQQGSLAIELREEGTVSALLSGEIGGQHCVLADGTVLSTVGLQQRIVVHVQQVAGLVVEQFQQHLTGCESQVVLPADALLWTPTVHPLDSMGQRFDAINAPQPAALTLRSAGALTLYENPTQLVAAPGTVSISVDTALPVQGLGSFTVVGPESLTAVQAALYLNKAAAKGSVVERIEDGMAYRLFFPDQSNSVQLLVDSAMTVRGKLCANLPPAWLAAQSSTPARCTASIDGKLAQSANPIAVATLQTLGECQLAVTIPAAAPGSNIGWSTHFSTAQ